MRQLLSTKLDCFSHKLLSMDILKKTTVPLVECVCIFLCCMVLVQNILFEW